MIDLRSAIVQNVEAVRNRVSRATHRAGRDPDEVLLVAVTKTHGPDIVRAAYDAGLRHFGENRVQEAVAKIDGVMPTLGPEVTWHMIGHVQGRKVATVAEHFDWIHSVDRMKVAQGLSNGLVKAARHASILMEVNLSGETTKSGYDLSHWPDDPGQERAFLAQAKQLLALPNMKVCGLMTIAPYTEEPESVRPLFRRLRMLYDSIGSQLASSDWRHLSMGMSGDFEVAIEEGATMVRIGTALFGPRN